MNVATLVAGLELVQLDKHTMPRRARHERRSATAAACTPGEGSSFDREMLGSRLDIVDAEAHMVEALSPLAQSRRERTLIRERLNKLEKGVAGVKVSHANVSVVVHL